MVLLTLTPELKTKFVSDAETQVEEFERQYLDGFITQGEKYNKVVDVWSRCSDQVADEMKDLNRKER